MRSRIADVIAPQPYPAWQTILDPLLTPGLRNYWKSHDFKEVSDGLIDTLIAHARKLPDPNTEIALAQLGGAVSRVPADATARAVMRAREPLTLAGLAFAEAAFKQLSPAIKISRVASDGHPVHGDHDILRLLHQGVVNRDFFEAGIFSCEDLVEFGRVARHLEPPLTGRVQLRLMLLLTPASDGSAAPGP